MGQTRDRLRLEETAPFGLGQVQGEEGLSIPSSVPRVPILRFVTIGAMCKSTEGLPRSWMPNVTSRWQRP